MTKNEKLLEKLNELTKEWKGRGYFIFNLAKCIENLEVKETLSFIGSIYISHAIDIKNLIQSLRDAEEIEKGAQK